MAAVLKIDSNVTSTKISEETSFGVADGSAVWLPVEVNSYGDTAGKFTKVARNPIDSDRQRKKGVTVDLEAYFGFTSDWTAYNTQTFLQGVWFADFRTKVEFGGAGQITAVNGSNQFTAASGLDAFAVGSLIVLRNGTQVAGNSNRVLRVTASTATLLTVAETLSAETLPTAAKLIKVGVRAGAGDLDVNAAGVFPVLTSTTLNFSTLGLVAGEWIKIGGDAALTFFPTNPSNNCFARVRAVSANSITLDKATMGDMVTESSTLDTIEIYIGRFLKNEQLALQVRRTYQIERQLGAPDDALPSQIQSEYFTGGIINEMTWNFNTASILTYEMKMICADQELRSGATGLKAGTRPSIENADAHNTSSDLKRVRLSRVVSGEEAPEPLFAYLPSLTLNINNGVEPLKALTVLGSFDASAGDFVVTAQCEGFFSDIDAISAVRDNDTLSLDILSIKNNQGMVIDAPLVTVGDGSIKAEKDRPLMTPLNLEFASGEEVDSALDYTLGITIWDGLPESASASTTFV